jgi:hypothetical protein
MPDINSIQTGDSGSAEFDISTVDFDEASDAAFSVDVIGCTSTINYDPTRDTHLSTVRSEQSDQNTENEAAEPNPSTLRRWHMNLTAMAERNSGNPCQVFPYKSKSRR